MSDERLSAEIVEALDGRDLEARIGWTIELLTVDADGWPRVALLSVGEVLAMDDRLLRLALWDGTHATANLTESGRGSLSFVLGAAAYTVRFRSCRVANLESPLRAVFDATVLGVKRDTVGYATLTSGISFELPDPGSVVTRWRAVIDALRGHPPCAGSTTDT